MENLSDFSAQVRSAWGDLECLGGKKRELWQPTKAIAAGNASDDAKDDNASDDAKDDNPLKEAEIHSPILLKASVCADASWDFPAWKARNSHGRCIEGTIRWRARHAKKVLLHPFWVVICGNRMILVRLEVLKSRRKAVGKAFEDALPSRWYGESLRGCSHRPHVSHARAAPLVEQTNASREDLCPEQRVRGVKRLLMTRWLLPRLE